MFLRLIRHASHPIVLNWYRGGPRPPVAILPSVYRLYLAVIFGRLALWSGDDDALFIATTENQRRALAIPLSRRVTQRRRFTEILLRLLLLTVTSWLLIRKNRLYGVKSSERCRHRRYILISVAAQKMAWKLALSTIRPSVIVCSTNFGSRTSALLLTAKALNFSLEYWPHSRLSKYYKHFLHDKVFLHPEDIIGIGHELTEGSCVSPLPGNPSKAETLRDVESRTVLVCLSLLDNAANVIEIDKVLSLLGFEIHYRIHPRERRNDLVPTGRVIVKGPWVEVEGPYFAGVCSISSAYFELQSIIGDAYVVAVNLTGGPALDVYEGMRLVEIEVLEKLMTDWKIK
jgi:hypothetical protein